MRGGLGCWDVSGMYIWRVRVLEEGDLIGNNILSTLLYSSFFGLVFKNLGIRDYILQPLEI